MATAAERVPHHGLEQIRLGRVVTVERAGRDADPVGDHGHGDVGVPQPEEEIAGLDEDLLLAILRPAAHGGCVGGHASLPSPR
jgi:hypothetical protein